MALRAGESCRSDSAFRDGESNEVIDFSLYHIWLDALSAATVEACGGIRGESGSAFSLATVEACGQGLNVAATIATSAISALRAG